MMESLWREERGLRGWEDTRGSREVGRRVEKEEAEQKQVMSDNTTRKPVASLVLVKSTYKATGF